MTCLQSLIRLSGKGITDASHKGKLLYLRMHQLVDNLIFLNIRYVNYSV